MEDIILFVFPSRWDFFLSIMLWDVSLTHEKLKTTFVPSYQHLCRNDPYSLMPENLPPHFLRAKRRAFGADTVFKKTRPSHPRKHGYGLDVHVPSTYQSINKY